MRIYLSPDIDSVAITDALYAAGLAETDMTYTVSEGYSLMAPDERFLAVVQRVDPGAGTTPRPQMG